MINHILDISNTELVKHHFIGKDLEFIGIPSNLNNWLSYGADGLTLGSTYKVIDMFAMHLFANRDVVFSIKNDDGMIQRYGMNSFDLRPVYKQMERDMKINNILD